MLVDVPINPEAEEILEEKMNEVKYIH